ncbi:Acyl-CoA dehydrogenase [Sphingobium faniae]|nr:Acyl-CoA dehydrogenase [Sphingobium faniae]
MRFDLDEQQRAFQQMVADYLETECPKARALEAHDRAGADLAIWEALMELGLGGIMVPEEQGGLGLGLLDLAIIAEPIGRFAAPGPFFDHALATLAIILAGSEEQKARWLPDMATGKLRGTVALAEEKGVWTAENWTLDGEARISGAKNHVLHPEGAGLLVVGLKGGRLGVVAGDAEGLAVEMLPSTDGGRQIGRVTFSEAAIELLPRAEGARLVDAGLILLAADAFGGASACVTMAVDYAREREQFGKPIGSFQAVKHQLADMALMVEPSVGLYWYAAHAFDTDPSSARVAARLAKSHITEVYPKVARRMIEAHGGIGYTWEYGAHVWLKRALFDQAYLGMPQAHRARVADLLEW